MVERAGKVERGPAKTVASPTAPSAPAAGSERPLLGGIPTVTAEEALAVDEVARKDGVSLDAVVNRAGYLAGRIVLEDLIRDLVRKPVAETSITILAGKGNKGAAALALGKNLVEAGAEVNVVLSRKTKEYVGPAKHHLSGLERGAKKVYTGYNERAFDQADLIIDGLIGAGLDGAPRASVSLLIKGANFSMKPIVALDVPSGLHASTGIQSAVTIKAAATLAVGLPKRGMLGKSNIALCGRVYLMDVGLPPRLWEKAGVQVGDVFGGKEWIRLETEA